MTSSGTLSTYQSSRNQTTQSGTALKRRVSFELRDANFQQDIADSCARKCEANIRGEERLLQIDIQKSIQNQEYLSSKTNELTEIIRNKGSIDVVSVAGHGGSDGKLSNGAGVYIAPDAIMRLIKYMCDKSAENTDNVSYPEEAILSCCHSEDLMPEFQASAFQVGMPFRKISYYEDEKIIPDIEAGYQAESVDDQGNRTLQKSNVITENFEDE